MSEAFFENESTHEDEQILDLILPRVTSNFIFLEKSFQHNFPWVAIGLWDWIFVCLAAFPYLRLENDRDA
jgi:hypothetical protein